MLSRDVLLFGLTLLFLLFAGCVGYEQQAAQDTTVTAPTTVQGETAEKGEVKEFKITAKQWEFIPNEIRVKKGDRVRLIVKSIDVTHGLAIPEYGINEELVPGKETVIEFVADKSGSFEGFCSIYCGDGHSDMKMKLIVE